jgi:uncharacterized membrane protein YeiB
MQDAIPRPDSGNPDSTAGHVPALDGVRGLAILGVLCVHLFPSGNTASNIAVRALLLVRNQYDADPSSGRYASC